MLNSADFLFLFADLLMINLLLFLKLSDMLFCEALKLAQDFLVHEVIANWWMTCDNDEWNSYSVDSDNFNNSDLIFVILMNLTHCQQFWWFEFDKSDDSDEKMLELCKKVSFNNYDLNSNMKRKEKKTSNVKFQNFMNLCYMLITWSVLI